MKESCNLAKKKCTPCEGGVSPLKGEVLESFYKQLDPGWRVIENHHLEKEYKFKNFKEALVFTNKVGAVAEHEGHHPDILLQYGKVQIKLWTHKVGGLTENDFILAAKCDSIA